jgi:PilZ domain
MSSSPVAYPQQRRSSRIQMAIPVSVQGLDASKEPYREEVRTARISAHGCSYQLRHEVLPGEIVVLGIGQPQDGYSEFVSKARVKWIQRLASGHEPAYDVGVELEIAGNIWGIASPPEDWVPMQQLKATEPSNAGRELRVVPRTESQIVPAQNAAVQVSLSKKSEATGALIPSFSGLLAGLGDQIQANLSETATAILYGEKNRLLEALRIQAQDEATSAVERVVMNAKDELVRRVLGELIAAQEATTRTNHERWIKTIEQDIGDARQRMLIQGNEVSQRIVSRLRDQVTPLLEDAKGELQKLVVSQSAFKEDSRAIYTRVAMELENTVNANLAKAHEGLNENSAAVLNEVNEKLVGLSQSFERATRDKLPSLVASATDDAKRILDERTAEMSNDFTAQLESHIRSYLEFIGDSIAEIPKKNLLR